MLRHRPYLSWLTKYPRKRRTILVVAHLSVLMGVVLLGYLVVSLSVPSQSEGGGFCLNTMHFLI
jgi:hypothetical protein